MKRAVSVVVLAGLLMTSNAHGQTWIGEVAGQAVRDAANSESLCRSGGIVVHTSDRQMENIRQGVQGTMELYVGLASAAERADVAAAFERRRSTWTRISDGVSITDLTAIADPLAARHGALGAPTQVLRAGDGRTATGAWLVTEAESGQVLGHYLGVFRRSGGRWKLLTLEVGEGSEAPQLTPYCHTPGDVDAYIAAQRALAPPKDPASTSEANENEQPADAVAVR